MSEIRIHCRVLPGMFKTEYYVLVNHTGAYYVDRHDVTVKNEPKPKEPVPGTVKAYVVQKDVKGKRLLVQLPGESAMGQQRTWIKQAEVA